MSILLQRQSIRMRLALDACSTCIARADSLEQFAIRTTIRNHTILKRDAVIKQVADAVGDHHVVDLHGYDLLILVEIYKVRTLSSNAGICHVCTRGVADYILTSRYTL